MYEKILIILSSLISVIGTIYAVLSILGMKAQDAFNTITLGGMANRDEEMLVQREQARLGIPMVVLGWIGQSVFSLIPIKTVCQFWISISITLAVWVLEIVIVLLANKKFRRKYQEFKREKAEDTHKDNHS